MRELRPTKARFAIVLAAVIGAVVAWLWARVDSGPKASSSLEPKSSPSPARASSEARDKDLESSGDLHAVPPPTPVPPLSAELHATARDDSTYFRVLAAMQARAEVADQLRVLMAWHEHFISTPDDPDWARQTERALRDFVQKHTAGGRLQVTSVSCRADNCEVQALGTMSDSRVPADERLMMPPTDLVVDYPVGPTLREQAGIRLGLGDRTGILLLYKRVRPEAEATGR